MAVEHSEVSRLRRYQATHPACTRPPHAKSTPLTEDVGDSARKLRRLRAKLDRAHAQHNPLQRLQKVLRSALPSLLARYASPTQRRALATALALPAAVLLCMPAVLAGFTLGQQPPSQTTVPGLPTSPTPTNMSTGNKAAAYKPALPATAVSLHPVAASPAADTLGVAPATIWLVDRGPNWELYSNGLRIETNYTVRGEPRRYRVHNKYTGVEAAVRTQPVGILFHTSESDIWPLDPDHQRQLRETSTALLNYVQKERAYNYVIDRFGRVYRIVDDATRANHAGHSVWADGNEVYLDLNSAFLGVSFESRWEGGRTLPITRAQLIAGHNLTNYLRQRFAIAPEMCVTHGLTSVNPQQHLIGYHMDWARGFPFAAFGLPDQYAVPPPSIALFGFGYNEDFLRIIGDGWPGALAGEAALAREATRRGIDLDTLRAQRRWQFSKWEREARVGANDRFSQHIDSSSSTNQQRG